MTDYYVDATGGNDGNPGTIAEPWQTMGKLAITSFNGGDVIHLKRGEVWRETWYVNTGGVDGNRVTYRDYGSGDLPRVTGCDLLSGWTNVPGTASLFADGFETGDTSAWSSETDADGDLNITALAALVGSYGAAITIDDANAAYVRRNFAGTQTTFRCRFYIDPNSMTMANNNEFVILRAIKTSKGFDAVLVKLRYANSSYNLFFYANADGGSVGNAVAPITDAPHYLEIEWKASTGAGANNGIVGFYVDGAQVGARYTNADTDTWGIDYVQWGAISEIDAGTSGTFFLDAFYCNNTGSVIGAAPDPSATTDLWVADYVDNIDTYLLLEDGEHLTRVTAQEDIDAVGKFYADNANNKIYVRCTDDADPDTHIMEIGARYDTVVCDDREHITFQNLHMHGAGGQYGRAFGVKPTWNTPLNITLTGCEISHAFYCGLWASYAATFTGIDGLTLDTCHIHNNLTIGARIEGEDSAHRMTNIALNGCEVDHNGNATFGQFGVWLAHCDAPETVNCNIHDNAGSLDWSDGLYHEDCLNLYAHHNTAHHNNHSGIHLDVGSYGRVELNVCYENTWNGIWIEEHQTSLGHATTVVHNTCYHNRHGLVFGPGGTIFEVSGVTAKNNIFAFNRRTNVELNEDNASPDYLNNTLDYNCYQTDPTDPLYQGEFRAQNPRVNLTFAQWKTYTGWDAHSLNVDPLLTDPDTLNFTLQTGSPCRDAGVDVGLTTDYDGNTLPQGGGFDMGAFEYLVATLLYRLRAEGY